MEENVIVYRIMYLCSISQNRNNQEHKEDIGDQRDNITEIL